MPEDTTAGRFSTDDDLDICPRCGGRAVPSGIGYQLSGARNERLLHELTLTQVRLLAELRSRYGVVVERDRPTIGCARDVYELLAPEMQPLLQEQLRVLLLDTKHRVLDAITVYQGTVNQITVRLAEVFRDAVMAGVPKIVLAHNHPSGVPDASPDDVAMTRDTAKAGELLGIELLDHVIVGRGCYESLKERGVF